MTEISNEVRFEVLHDFLKTKFTDAEERRAEAIDDEDESKKRASEREMNIADLWLNDLFNDFEAQIKAEKADFQRKLDRWRQAVGA